MAAEREHCLALVLYDSEFGVHSLAALSHCCPRADISATHQRNSRADDVCILDCCAHGTPNFEVMVNNPICRQVRLACLREWDEGRGKRDVGEDHRDEGL